MVWLFSEKTRKELAHLQKVIYDKVMILRHSISQIMHGSNLDLLIDAMYDAVFYPKTMNKWIERLNIKDEKGKFAGRHARLLEEVTDQLVDVTLFKKAVEKELFAIDYSECLYERTNEMLLKMLLSGVVRIWTGADVDGQNKENLPFVYHRDLGGSTLQYYKIRQSSTDCLNTIMSEFMLNHRFYLKRHQILIEAAIDKSTRLDGIFADFKELGVDIVVIVDDWMRQLLKAKEVMNNWPMSIWMFYHGLMLKESPKFFTKRCGFDEVDKYSSMQDIGDVDQILLEIRKQGYKNPGFIIDWDGVCMDNEPRHKMEAMAFFYAIEAL